MSTKTHYVYSITNITNNKKYIGKRSTLIEPDLDLGKKYFSSSTDESFIKEQNEHPENFKYDVLKIFNSVTEATQYEIKLHKEYDVGSNEKYYNKVIQSSSGFDVSGKVSVKDSNGNIQLISKNDPRYLSGELLHVNSNKVVVIDEEGIYYSVSVDDPRYISGELKHNTKNKLAVRNTITNETFQTYVDDPRFITGEIVAIRTGYVPVKDAEGNTFSVSKNDPRYLSGELTHVFNGLINVRDKDGNFLKVRTDDPRYLSGELVGQMKGMITVKDKDGFRFSVPKDDPRYLSGELVGHRKGMKRSKDTIERKKWIHNVDLKINKLILKNDIIPNGWNLGKLKKKDSL